MNTQAGRAKWRLLVDANTHRNVGVALERRGHDVLYVNEVLPAGTDDDIVDQFARSDRRVIIGHDKAFLRKVQQKTFQFPDSLSTGYGRIMLIGREKAQPERMAAALPFIELCYGWTLANDPRFLMIVADHCIRYDDGMIRRVPSVKR